MRIVAICKTFRGEEFALASLASIYDHVANVVYVHSNIGWNGDIGNTVIPIVTAAPDPLGKLIHLYMEGTQAEQYDFAVKYLLEKGIEFDYIMLIDTDEVWDQTGWDTAKPALIENIKNGAPAKSFKVGLHDYVKSPFYQVYPVCPARPTAFLHSSGLTTGIGLRGLGIGPAVQLQDTYYHHFCSVRYSLAAVLNKHNTSCTAETEPMVDMAVWIRDIWNKLPKATDCLPLVRYRHYWKGIKVIQWTDLPDAVRNNPLVLAWMKYPVVENVRRTAANIRQPVIKARTGYIPPRTGPHPAGQDPRIRTRWGAVLPQSK